MQTFLSTRLNKVTSAGNLHTNLHYVKVEAAIFHYFCLLIRSANTHMHFCRNPVICFCRLIPPKARVSKYLSKHAILATDLSAHNEVTLSHIATSRKIRLVNDAISLMPDKTKMVIAAPRKHSVQLMHPPYLIRGFAG